MADSKREVIENGQGLATDFFRIRLVIRGDENFNQLADLFGKIVGSQFAEVGRCVRPAEFRRRHGRLLPHFRHALL